ncbi:MAG: Rossmann-like and DUF2520 domain-containing protein [Planctomycetota bacterium]|jgi:predicted short-subunit dehydrogenase-like oxidoreductase (DUF2520 family)
MKRPPLAIYGVGRLGRALAVAANAAGLQIAAIGNRSSTVSPLAGIKVNVGLEDFMKSLDEPSIVFLSVSDDAVSQVAAGISRRVGDVHWYAHTAGSRGSAELKPLDNRGCFHLLQSFPKEDGAKRVAGSFCAITAPEPLSGWLSEIAEAMGARSFELTDDARPAYHTAAVVASNALVGLAETGHQILEQHGISDSAELLLPLMQGTLANLIDAKGDTRAALTGPIARGDVETITKHLAALPPEQRESYICLMKPLIEIAECDEGAKTKIREMFDSVEKPD